MSFLKKVNKQHQQQMMARQGNSPEVTLTLGNENISDPRNLPRDEYYTATSITKSGNDLSSNGPGMMPKYLELSNSVAVSRDISQSPGR